VRIFRLSLYLDPEILIPLFFFFFFFILVDMFDYYYNLFTYLNMRQERARNLKEAFQSGSV